MALAAGIVLAGCAVPAQRRGLITDTLNGDTPRSQARDTILAAGLCAVRTDNLRDVFAECKEAEPRLVVVVEHDGEDVLAVEQWWRHRTADLPLQTGKPGTGFRRSWFVPADWALERLAEELQARYGDPSEGLVWELAHERVSLSRGDYAHIVERHEFR